MIDTAGRLHNKANLMAELEKISRVLKKKGKTIHPEVLLVLDATTGRECHLASRDILADRQIDRTNRDQLDGMAKEGGVVVALADKFQAADLCRGRGRGYRGFAAVPSRRTARTLVGLSA